MIDAARLARIDAALAAGDVSRVVDDACAMIDEEPTSKEAQRAYLRVLLAWARGQPGLADRTFPLPSATRGRRRVSAIVCSIDAAKYAAVVANLNLRFAGHEFEVVGIHDARSLAEAYNRGAAKARGDILVFAHDDIELRTSDFAARLFAHLERYDGVGVAGASKITGPRWDHAGQRHIHGHVLHLPPEGKTGVLLMAAGFQRPVCEDIRVLDGVFVAVHRRVWEAHKFDAKTYDGFHGYDLDFTRRASGAGARFAVPLDLLLLHRSTGRYGGDWRRYAQRFADQLDLDASVPPAPGGLQVRLDTPAQIDTMRAALVHFRFGAARTTSG
jgi:hypothetical protein